MNIEPKFEPLAPCTKEKPATVSTCATPLVCSAISFDLRQGGPRAFQRRRVGQLHAGHDSALVLLRDEPRGAVLERRVGQNEQNSVDHQHQHVDPQKPSHDPGVSARCWRRKPR